MKRLFFALWPDDTTRQKIDCINRQIDQKGLKKLQPTNLHATLVFLGNVDDKTADAVQKAAAFIKAAPFSLSFDELNFWPKPRILCLTCRRQPKLLYSLVNALMRMVQEHSVRLDNKRPYRAHITLARKATANPQLEFGAIEWSADSFALVQSRSTDKGVCYEVIDSWPLLKD